WDGGAGRDRVQGRDNVGAAPAAPSERRAKLNMDATIKDFESAIAELETIVKTLEEGDLALEKSLALFERGVTLSRFCRSKLEEAERRVDLLNERGESRTAPASLAREPHGTHTRRSGSCGPQRH